jgi:hypothetical protein
MPDLTRDSWTNLDDWLAAVFSPQTQDQLVHFPSDQLRDQYLETVEARDESEVLLYCDG